MPACYRDLVCLLSPPTTHTHTHIDPTFVPLLFPWRVELPRIHQGLPFHSLCSSLFFLPLLCGDGADSSPWEKNPVFLHIYKPFFFFPSFTYVNACILCRSPPFFMSTLHIQTPHSSLYTRSLLLLSSGYPPSIRINFFLDHTIYVHSSRFSFLFVFFFFSLSLVSINYLLLGRLKTERGALLSPIFFVDGVFIKQTRLDIYIYIYIY